MKYALGGFLLVFLVLTLLYSAYLADPGNQARTDEDKAYQVELYIWCATVDPDAPGIGRTVYTIRCKDYLADKAEVQY